MVPLWTQNLPRGSTPSSPSPLVVGAGSMEEKFGKEPPTTVVSRDYRTRPARHSRPTSRTTVFVDVSRSTQYPSQAPPSPAVVA